MAKLEKYREKVQQLLSNYFERFSRPEEDTLELIFDTTREHYMLMDAGWLGQRREYGILIHLNIKNQKIWIQHDGTEAGMANELLEMDIPKEDIVLGFHSPFMRQHTEFAVE